MGAWIAFRFLATVTALLRGKLSKALCSSGVFVSTIYFLGLSLKGAMQEKEARRIFTCKGDHYQLFVHLYVCILTWGAEVSVG